MEEEGGVDVGCGHGCREKPPRSLRQGVDDVFHQHGADQHLLAVDGQVRCVSCLLLQGDQDEASTANRLCGKSIQRESRHADATSVTT